MRVYSVFCISQLRLNLLVTPTVSKKLQTNVMLSYKLFIKLHVFKFCLSPFKNIIFLIIFFCHCTFMKHRTIYILINGYTAHLYHVLKLCHNQQVNMTFVKSNNEHAHCACNCDTQMSKGTCNTPERVKHLYCMYKHAEVDTNMFTMHRVQIIL